jgi:hypothetical protein
MRTVKFLVGTLGYNESDRANVNVAGLLTLTEVMVMPALLGAICKFVIGPPVTDAMRILFDPDGAKNGTVIPLPEVMV